MELKSGIYIIENLANGKVYVGSTNNFSVRWKRHVVDLNKSVHSGSKLQRAWLKYGQASFTFSVLEYIDDLSLLLQREQHWLDLLKSVENGYNVLPVAGNNAGHKLSEAHKQAFSFRGKKHGQDSKQKMSQAKIGREVSDEVRLQLQTMNIGRVISEETRAKMREAARKREAAKRNLTIEKEGAPNGHS